MGENTWKLIGHMEQLDTGHQKKIKTIYLENVQIFTLLELQSLSSGVEIFGIQEKLSKECRSEVLKALRFLEKQEPEIGKTLRKCIDLQGKIAQQHKLRAFFQKF